MENAKNAVIAPESAGGDADFNPAPEVPPSPDLCPKCQQKLIDPNGLGWCKACGYCKSLEEDKARVPLETRKVEGSPSRLGAVEFYQVMANLPNWVWVMIGGVIAVFAINVPPTRAMAADSLPRAILSSSEILLGVLMILAAQTWALCLLAHKDDSLHFKDAIIPGRLWSATLGRLPETQAQVWLASWGLACILSGVLVIGGLSHWLSYLPKKAAPPANVEQVD